MTYTSFPLESFGKGLNLRDKPDAVDPEECIDAMNVVFSDRGAIQRRFGYGAFSVAPLANTVLSMEPFYTTGGIRQLAVGGAQFLQTLSNAGISVAEATGLTAGPFFDFARFGKPNEEVLFAGNGANTLRKWNGVAWSTPTATVNGVAAKAMPKAGAICVDPNNNRLVCSAFRTTTGGPDSTVSSPSHIYYSEPGEPEKYDTTAVVQLTPGDGEQIQAVIAWREFVFVFKESKFFVFTGNETDSEGKPIFNWRPVETGVGLTAPKGICIHQTGVYFVHSTGVYRTAGQEPELVSSPIEPVFHTEEAPSPFYLGGVIDQTQFGDITLESFEDRIELGFPSKTANDRTLVFDTKFEWWSLADLPARAFATFKSQSFPELFFARGNLVYRYSPDFVADAGAAISSRWRCGWFDLESPDVKTIRSTKLWGGGHLFCGLGYDFKLDVGQLVALDFSAGEVTQWDGSTWGGGEWAEPRGLLTDERRVAVRGTVFSLYFQSQDTDSPWSIHRVSHHLRETKRPSVVRA